MRWVIALLDILDLELAHWPNLTLTLQIHVGASDSKASNNKVNHCCPCTFTPNVPYQPVQSKALVSNVLLLLIAAWHLWQSAAHSTGTL
jgi:hypothetical protein